MTECREGGSPVIELAWGCECVFEVDDAAHSLIAHRDMFGRCPAMATDRIACALEELRTISENIDDGIDDVGVSLLIRDRPVSTDIRDRSGVPVDVSGNRELAVLWLELPVRADQSVGFSMQGPRGHVPRRMPTSRLCPFLRRLVGRLDATRRYSDRLPQVVSAVLGRMSVHR